MAGLRATERLDSEYVHSVGGGGMRAPQELGPQGLGPGEIREHFEENQHSVLFFLFPQQLLFVGLCWDVTDYM